MKRLENILTRQKNALLLDVILAIVLLVSIGIAAFGMAKTLAATTGWNEAPQPMITAASAELPGVERTTPGEVIPG